jgi:SAM-dependent methyltransferase
MKEQIRMFVGEDRKIQTGRDAEILLRETSDAKYVEEGCGIVRVPRDRWAMAQRYERGTWMDAAAHALDDRNYEHAANFDGYGALAGKSFDRAIELGCGPFTNLRVIGAMCEIKHCTLVDPLIPDYKKHRHCSYRHGILETGTTPLNSILGRSLTGRAVRRVIRNAIPSLLLSGVPIEQLIAAPIEAMPGCGQFELVVMINVIEHCFDVHAILETILRLCPRGALFVFHDRLYNAATVRREAAERFDAGHPLKVDESLIVAFLHSSFQVLFERRVDVKDEAVGVELTEPGVYFVGERK